VFRGLLRCTHRAIEMRERARLKQALLYGRCRRIALAIGDRLVANGTLEAAEDVFFFEYSELDDLLSGYALFPGSSKETVSLRKRSTSENHGAAAPDTFTFAEGAYLSRYAADRGAPSVHKTSDGSEMRGLGVCGGRVTARATVLESLAGADLLRQGDILVTRQTDPGWAPVFPLIRGLVIERGGMLSHGAIIAREFGLPCVAGVKDALLRIPQHCQLTVDGDTGNVRTLD
jgi:pyruvate,water dikinase